MSLPSYYDSIFILIREIGRLGLATIQPLYGHYTATIWPNLIAQFAIKNRITNQIRVMASHKIKRTECNFRYFILVSLTVTLIRSSVVLTFLGSLLYGSVVNFSSRQVFSKQWC